ncbi:hypothetical protein FHS51_000568 [Sphingobium wenxiniae]|uniref:Lipoprotein n=3 Tax=Sphingomonadaceae TaxID=41297 RepID=T0G792_9SPHN|nr:hypothetical protein L485_14955 [Sphingobium baderi LL03]KMS61181.1 hypothetical protein V475_15465 [Sphingobium baderi LL03]MBB6190355.1 hypothetical protein [Sphingobium wenxiniae]TWH95074.1 hypothetical protein IQ35_01326 [Sphingobium wenxiniae]
MTLPRIALTGMILLALAGCSRRGEIDATGGIVAVRSACPTAAIPAYTGDVTLFNPAQSRDASAIDVVANITDLRSTCADGAQFYTEATFTVNARRSDPTGARQVTLPYFATVVRGGNAVIAKRVGQVTLNFEPGQYRASAAAKAGSYVDKGAATLPADIQRRITAKRKAGDEDAAIDPFSQPDVKAALQRTSFELLVGFNLTQDQLKYNATR